MPTQTTDLFLLWVAEQTPEELLAVLTAFLAPYRAGSAAARDARPHAAAASAP